MEKILDFFLDAGYRHGILGRMANNLTRTSMRLTPEIRRILDELARRREKKTGRRPSMAALLEEGARRLAEEERR